MLRLSQLVYTCLLRGVRHTYGYVQIPQSYAVEDVCLTKTVLSWATAATEIRHGVYNNCDCQLRFSLRFRTRF